jgi:hypothetical protein
MAGAVSWMATMASRWDERLEALERHLRGSL